MKRVSICICCYNEVENVRLMYDKIVEIMESISDIQFEIIFSDNDSKDGTQDILKELAKKDKRVKVILNIRNFGPARSGRNCIYSSTGDAVIAIPCDFQEPPEMIPEFIKEWKKDNLIVWGQKVESHENGLKYYLRKLYYKIIQKCADYPQFYQTTGFGIMDKSVIKQLMQMKEPEKSFRHMVAELGYPVKFLPYTQEIRKRGKSSFNIRRWLDFSIKSLVHTSRQPVRLTTLLGTGLTFLGILGEVVLFVIRLLAGYTISWMWFWNFLLLSLMGIQLLAIGFVGEYVIALSTRLSDKPYVIEKDRINF